MRALDVTFTKLGTRRYGVTIFRGKAPDLIMAPAPGYDPFLPHDLVHFVAECEWGLQHGIFGQLAEGGDAGTFIPLRITELRKQRARGARIRAAHRSDTGRSERLAQLTYVAWKTRRSYEISRWERAALDEVEDADAAVLDRAVERLAELAERWHTLQVGASITLPWPLPEGPRHSASRRNRRRVRPAVRRRARS